jgi:hypothetical protein
MANDRLFVRCTKCGDYEYLGKYYPSMAGHVDRRDELAEFVDKHLDSCQLGGMCLTDYGDADQPMCIVFDHEATFCAAGGLIGGGTGNVNKDKELKNGAVKA